MKKRKEKKRGKGREEREDMAVHHRLCLACLVDLSLNSRDGYSSNRRLELQSSHYLYPAIEEHSPSSRHCEQISVLRWRVAPSSSR